MVALQVAIDRADLTRSLVVIDSSADAPNADVAGTYGRVMAGIEKDGLSDEIIEILMPFTFGERYRSESPDGVAAQHSRLHDMKPDAFIEGMRTLVTRRSLLDRLGEIRVPTLVIHGDEDASQPVAEAEKIAAGIAGAELVRISGAGHSTPIEAPDEVNAALAAFYSKI
jgi:pimeloyl-ACP methyl ester carboxylesterase